jgi:hypothetical protein
MNLAIGRYHKRQMAWNNWIGNHRELTRLGALQVFKAGEIFGRWIKVKL